MVPRISSIDSVDIQLNVFDENYSATDGSTAPGHMPNLQVDSIYNVQYKYVQCTMNCTVCIMYSVLYSIQYVPCTVYSTVYSTVCIINSVLFSILYE